MSFSEATIKFQKLSKRVTAIAFSVGAVICTVTFIVLGVSLNNNSIGVTAATVVACVIAVAVITALFVTCFILNKINLKYLEEARASEEEADKVKNAFVANMSHDIRTRLNDVMGMTEIAIANIDDSKRVENCLKKISLSSRQLVVIINKVLDKPESESADTATPVADGEPAVASPASVVASEEIDLKGKRILVAEDNDLNWEIAELLLSSEGLEVEHAENGQTCVDMLLSHKPGYYDAILMDVRMPVMSGLEATTVIRGLRKNYRGIPIIAMTADAFAEDMQKCLECGMNAHIAKPIDVDVVKATLAKYIIKEN